MRTFKAFWGFTWQFENSWLKTAEPVLEKQNTYYVSAKFQNVWDSYFKKTKCNIIRFDINVMDYSSSSGNRKKDLLRAYTNLCIWSRKNDAWLFPVLGKIGNWSRNKDRKYANAVGPFVTELAKKVLRTDPDAYRRIIAFQVENEMNHFYHHKYWAEEDEHSLLIKGSKAVRAGENQADISRHGLKSTPLCINMNYDFYSLIGPITGGYPKLHRYIQDLIDGGAEFDIIGLDYYPRTWSWHNIEDLMTILKKLVDDFGMRTPNKKRIAVAETGYSTQFPRPKKWQKNYYERLTDMMVEYYKTGGGRTGGFKGVLWYNFMSSDKFAWVRREKHFGIIKRNDDGTVNRCKQTYYWMRDNQDLPPWG